MAGKKRQKKTSICKKKTRNKTVIWCTLVDLYSRYVFSLASVEHKQSQLTLLQEEQVEQLQ